MLQPICLLISFSLAWRTMNQFCCSTSHSSHPFKSQAINPLYEIINIIHFFWQFCYFNWSSVGVNALLHSSSNASREKFFFKYSLPTLLPVKKKNKNPRMLYFRDWLLYVCVYVIFFFFFTLWKSFICVVQAIFTAVYGDRCGFKSKNYLPWTLWLLRKILKKLTNLLW